MKSLYNYEFYEVLGFVIFSMIPRISLKLNSVKNIHVISCQYKQWLKKCHMLFDISNTAVLSELNLKLIFQEYIPVTHLQSVFETTDSTPFKTIKLGKYL